MPRGRRTLKSKFLLVAGVSVFGGLTLSVAVSVIGVRTLSERSSREIERGLTEANRALVEKQLDDLHSAIERLVGPTLADLGVATDFAQGVVDRRDVLAPVSAAALRVPGLTPELRYQPKGKMLQSIEGGDNLLGVFDYNLKAERPRPDAQRVVEDSALIGLVLSPLAKNGTAKLQVYYVGPKATPVLRMAPWVDIAAVWNDLYPGASEQPFYQFFFPGLVEGWERMLQDRARFTAHQADPVMYPPYEDAAGGGLIVTFFRPLWTADRAGFAGVMGIDVTLDRLLASIAGVRLGASGFAFLVEADGNLLAISDEGAARLEVKAGAAPQPGVKVLKRNLRESARPEVAALGAALPDDDTTRFVEVELGGAPHLVALRRGLGFDIQRSEAGVAREHWTVGLALPKREIFGALTASQAVVAESGRTITGLQLLITGLTLFAVLVGLFVVTQRLTAPLGALTTAAHALQQRNYAVQVPEVASDDEVAALTRAFNAMAADARAHTENLEATVAQRTEALNRTLAELWSEMDLARKIQTVLLPGQAALQGYEVAALMRPASNVGGDYYDYFRAGDAQWLLIGDVSGHGVTSGLIMMMAQTAVRTTTRVWAEGDKDGSPAEVLAMVNASIQANLEKIGRGQYMTITALRLAEDGVTYSGLHQDMMVYRAKTGRVERVETTGVWVGLLDDLRPFLEDERLVLERGDLLLLHTDGITEARVEGRMWGLEGLEGAFRAEAAAGKEGRALIDGILARLPAQEFDDDVTLVAVTRR